MAITKQDLLEPSGRAKAVQETRVVFENALARYRDLIKWKIFDIDGLNARDGFGFESVLLDIAETMEEHRDTYQLPEEKTAIEDREPSKDELVKRIKEEKEQDTSTATFWSQFESSTLPAWNHRSHLRAGFLILLRCMQKMESVLEATDIFLEHLGRLRASNPDRFANTAHRSVLFSTYPCSIDSNSS